MKRAAFLRRMATAALACAFIDGERLLPGPERPEYPPVPFKIEAKSPADAEVVAQMNEMWDTPWGRELFWTEMADDMAQGVRHPVSWDPVREYDRFTGKTARELYEEEKGIEVYELWVRDPPIQVVRA